MLAVLQYVLLQGMAGAFYSKDEAVVGATCTAAVDILSTANISDACAAGPARTRGLNTAHLLMLPVLAVLGPSTPLIHEIYSGVSSTLGAFGGIILLRGAIVNRTKYC